MRNFAKVLAAGAVWGMAAAAMAKPDLVISSITLSTNRAYPGDSVRIDSVTRNNGDATGWWKYCDVYYYWGTTTNLANATQIGSGATPNYQEVNGIDKGEEEEDTLNWTIPAGTAPGIYYITCVADAEKEIDESNENNNRKSVKFTVIGTPSFSDVKWLDPMDISSNDWATAYGECANLPEGTRLSMVTYKDNTLFDDAVATNYPTVRQANGMYYFVQKIQASWETGDYYFQLSVTKDGRTYTTNSGTAGAALKVTTGRMTPSVDTGDFYYGNDNGGGTVSVLPSTAPATTALQDGRIPIILVHGMSGDAKPKTLNYWYGWVNGDQGSGAGPLGYFNQAPMSNMFRVYRYVYDSRDFISTNGVKLAKFVNDFYGKHREFEGRQVVLMAHSMGGLVCRYAMNANTQFAARVHRLVTLGSPHLGSQGANPTWIKYSGPDNNSWLISGVYNTFDMHNNTAGCFDLAWYATNEIPTNALTEAAIAEMGDDYRTDLMRKSLRNPMAGWSEMRSKAADNKCVLFGGSSTNRISDYLSSEWTTEASKEVGSDHLGLWVATKIFRGMSYADGSGVGDNDGLVPTISALMADSLKCAKATDRNGHPTAVKYNLNATEGQQVDHASYLDVPVTMDSVKAVLLTQVLGICQPADAIAKGAKWRLIDNATDETSPWQRSEVRLPALVAGRSYTVEFGAATNYSAPAKVTFTATKSVTKRVVGTYKLAGAANQAPTDLELSHASVPENAPVGTPVGTLSAIDPEGDKLTYRLAAGDGDADNACFSIVSNRLLTAQVFDYEQASSLSCRIRVSDTNNAATEKAFAITVLDVDETTPGEAEGDAWLNLSWAAVPGADYYEVDVVVAKDVSYPTPNQSLGTNKFLAGQHWRYEAPGGKTTTTSGSVKTSPCWFTYGTTNAHGLFGTNGMALMTEDLPLDGASAASIDFQNANWNGKGTAAVSRVNAYYRVDEGAWQFIGYNQSTNTGDGGETNYWGDLISLPEGASTVAFKLEAPNAWRDSFQRGPYVTTATASLYGQRDFEDADYHVPGYPRYVNTTNLQIQKLPANTPYWWRVTAHAGANEVNLGYGSAWTEGVVPAPTGLTVTSPETNGSTSLTATWTDPGAVDHFEVELTPVVAASLQKALSTVPNVDLAGEDNTSGWSYSANHAATTRSWFCAQATPKSDYHGLLVATLPGIQSPMLDLSGIERATLQFVARTRGKNEGVTGVPMYLYYSLDGGLNWTASTNTVSTNTANINNSRFLYLDVPEEALRAGVRLELGVPGATGTGSVWQTGVDGNGVRNITLLGVGEPAPDYEAEAAVALEPVPAPLANAVEAGAEATATAKGLATATTYYVRVRSVDAWGHASAWVEAIGRTGEANAPTALSLSGRSIRANNEAGEYIGQLSAEDADEGDEIRYELVDGEGSDGNGLVEVRGATLRTAGTFLARDGATRRVRVRATDSQGLWTEQVFELDVLTVEEGVLIDPAAFAAMAAANRGVEFTSASACKEGLRATWTDAGAWEGARAAAKYDVYVSTDLREGFVFQKRVEATEWTMPQAADTPVTFWVVLVAE